MTKVIEMVERVKCNLEVQNIFQNRNRKNQIKANEAKHEQWNETNVELYSLKVYKRADYNINEFI